MVWNFLSKGWAASANQSKKNASPHSLVISSNLTSSTISVTNTPSCLKPTLHRITRFYHQDDIVSTTRSAYQGWEDPPSCAMERQRSSTKRGPTERQRSVRGPSFRMRISRRIRAGFMPVPQQDSDQEPLSEPTPAGGATASTRRNALQDYSHPDEPLVGVKHGNAKDKNGKRHEERLRRESEDTPETGSDGHHHGGSLKGLAKDAGSYDLTVDSRVQLGFSFRQKRRSFGSESEKRRGERFQRLQNEKRKAAAKEAEALSDDSSDSSVSHVCDFQCPLISLGPCPKSGLPQPSVAGGRRSSFTTPTSRDTSSSRVTPLSHRPAALASVSTEDLAGPELDGGLPVKSPGMLSTASMWSTSDLHQAGQYKADPETVSRTAANSLSNVSETLSERMHELARAFSNRTHKAKEKISQPPTPSSDSDNDAKSASGTEETQGTRNIRLGSFLPMGSQASDAFSDENHDHFVGVWHCRFKTPKFLQRLRFPSTVEPHSKMYVSWLFLVSLAFLYNAVVIPLRGVFPYQTSDNVHYWLMMDYLCDLVYLMDIILFKCRLRFINDGIVECNRRETRKNYMTKLMFKLDMMSLTPLDLFYFIKSVGVNPWLRLPRVLKIQTYWEFYEKCDQASRSSAHAIRIVKTVTYMLFLIHVETCGYYAVSVYEGLGTNKWVYSGQGIAYIRCFYLATKTATSIGNNPPPTNQLELSFMTLYWLSGVFVFALLIGQIRDIVEAAGMVKDNYRKKMDSCLWYMQSINLPKEMKDRVRMWFLYNWDQQKTIDERSLVRSLPKKLQTDLAINVHFNTLSKVQLFQDCERNLLYDLVLKLRPILYLPGDYICKKGEVGKEMYIVSQGQVEVVGGENNETVLATLHEGSVFGEISLLAMSGRGNRRTADVRSKGYTNVFTLSKHDFEMAMTEYPDAQAVLKKRARKLLRANARLERQHKKLAVEEIIKTSPDMPKMVQTVIQVMDPDSNFVKQLGSGQETGSHQPRMKHSRSHSHKLSTSASSLHHLTTPHRSHSFRVFTQSTSLVLSPSLTNPHQPASSLGSPRRPTSFRSDKSGFDTDDENDDLTFDDTSEDISLSEALHDALATSSFDDEEDGDSDSSAEGDDEASIIEHRHYLQHQFDKTITYRNATGDVSLVTNTYSKVKESSSRKISNNSQVSSITQSDSRTNINSQANSNSHANSKSQVNGNSQANSNTQQTNTESQINNNGLANNNVQTNSNIKENSNCLANNNNMTNSTSPKNMSVQANSNRNDTSAVSNIKSPRGVPSNNNITVNCHAQTNSNSEAGTQGRIVPGIPDVWDRTDEADVLSWNGKTGRQTQNSLDSSLISHNKVFGSRETLKGFEPKQQPRHWATLPNDSSSVVENINLGHRAVGNSLDVPNDNYTNNKDDNNTNKRSNHISTSINGPDINFSKRDRINNNEKSSKLHCPPLVPIHDPAKGILAFSKPKGISQAEIRLQTDTNVDNCLRSPCWLETLESCFVFPEPTGVDSHKLPPCASPKLDRLLQPCLRMCDENTERIQEGATPSRQRKLSVVTPPISPVSPRDKLHSQWSPGGKVQFSSAGNVQWLSSGPQHADQKDSLQNADLLMRSFTPDNTASMTPLPVSDTAKVSISREVGKPCLKIPASPVLTNGLEACCGAGLVVGIPSENNLTFAVEIHRQKNIAKTITDIHGHTETML